jgi:hypothetical protein
MFYFWRCWTISVVAIRNARLAVVSVVERFDGAVTILVPIRRLTRR